MERPVLLRIPFSHFCRKVEWGLTYAGVPYDALDVKLWDMGHTPRVNPAGTVPVLRVGSRLLQDSHECMVWADEHRDPTHPEIYPRGMKVAVADWETWMGTHVAPAVRLEAYRALHRDPSLARGYDGIPWQMRFPGMARRAYLGVLKHYKARRTETTDPRKVREGIAAVAKRLDEQGTGFLFDARPTAADITTAALLQPLTLIAEASSYGTESGWDAVAAHIERIRPKHTLLQHHRKVKATDWKEWEELNITQAAHTHGPMAA